MKFEDIGFEERIVNGKREWGTETLGGYWVSKEIFATAWKLLNVHINSVSTYEICTARQLIGELNWKGLTIGARQKYGRAIKYFVDNGMVSMTVNNEGKKGSRKYMVRF